MTNLNSSKVGNHQLTDARIAAAIHAAIGTSPISIPRPALAVAVGGSIVGVLDLLYAIVVYSPRHPIIIPQAIASGVLGEKAYRGGIVTAILGIVLHFTIAFGAAITYYLASRKLPFLIRHAVPFGLLYGASVYFFMHLIVLPLSAGQFTPLSFTYTAGAEFVWHWFGFGLPIALSVRHYSQ